VTSPFVTAPFVTELRTDASVIILGDESADSLHLRVQAAELWETIRIDAPKSDSVIAVKTAALSSFYPEGVDVSDFVTKLHGFEILDESASLAAAGARDGSTLLLTYRRRRPVR
jgi:hypothetical protein